MSLKNLYFLQDSGSNCFGFLEGGIINRGWEQWTIDNFLFTKSGITLIAYVDYAILLSSSKSKIQYEINLLRENFDLTEGGELKDYFGAIFEHNKKYGSITLT